jgi:hypothetical protein
MGHFGKWNAHPRLGKIEIFTLFLLHISEDKNMECFLSGPNYIGEKRTTLGKAYEIKGW